MHSVGRRLGPGAAALLAGAGVLPLVLLVHGFLPGLINDGPWSYLLEGDMRCLNEMGTEAVRSWCNWYGLPVGYPFMSSGPIAWLGWALMYTTGMGSYPAYLITAGFFDAVALAGGYGLMRALKAGRVVALGASAAYLVSPTLVGMLHFGGTFTGYTLLPAYALADVVAMRAVRDGNRRRVAIVAGAYVAVRTFALFLDGYSFVLSALLAGILWTVWLVREPLSRRRRAAALGILAGAHLVAVALYELYTPAFPATSPLEIFRSMGLDVVTLVLPTDFVWSADLLGIGADHTDLWGDTTNAEHNFVGIVSLGLAAVGLACRFRERHVAPLAAAGVIALVLALGPSLKVDDTRPVIEGLPTAESYLMPADVATADLPWGGVYTALPGLEDMRASYRWSGLTRLALIILAGLAVDRLARVPRRRVLAGVVAVVALAEIAPNVPLLYDSHSRNHAQRAAFDADVVPDLQTATERGERVFFLSVDDSYNDYIVNYLAPTMEVRAFNAGGDKNAQLARNAWPQELNAIAAGDRTSEDIEVALTTALNVVVAPFFDLRLATYAWPATAEEREAAERRFAPILDDPRFDVDRYDWFATIRLRQP